MTGKTHRQFGYAWAAGLAILMQPWWGWLGVAALFIGVRPGSTAPDWMECKGMIKHRTITHLPWLWVTLFALSVSRIEPNIAMTVLACMCVGFCLGAMSHWAGDLGTPMGVPLLLPHKRVSLRWWKTGKSSEKLPVLAAWVVVAALLALRWWVPHDAWVSIANVAHTQLHNAYQYGKHILSGPIL